MTSSFLLECYLILCMHDIGYAFAQFIDDTGAAMISSSIPSRHLRSITEHHAFTVDMTLSAPHLRFQLL